MFFRRSDGEVELTLSRDERALLAGLAAELRAQLDDDTQDPSLRRLFPPAYEDEADERAYGELAGDSLLEGRREALELLARTVDRDRLSAEEADAWLRALNDLRLVLGTRLDVQEDTFASDMRPDDPNAPALAVYGYLSWIQEQLVAALSP
ncbi:MAG: DUF2017 family protein [Gaiellaceae bacterium]